MNRNDACVEKYSILTELSAMSETVGRLMETLGRLETRLAPLLQNIPKDCCDKTARLSNGLRSKVGSEMTDLSHKIENVIHNLEELNSSLEL